MSEQVNVLTHMTTQEVTVQRTREQIELDLSRFGPNVTVFASRETEDGTELLLEGPVNEVADLIWFWGQDVFI